MEISLKYGTTSASCHLPDRTLLGVLRPNREITGVSGPAEVRRSLADPIGAKPLGQLVRSGMKVAVITSDITRPVPSHVILPEVLDELRAAGIDREDITVVFALGSHRPQTEAEKRALVGDRIYSEYRCLDHDPEDCVPLGYTANGTPIEVFRPVVEADFRVCVGNIEYHYFAGYSGGYKAIVPGVCTPAAIQKNHSKMTEAGALAGNLDGNPVREDLESAYPLCPADFIVNVILNSKKEIIHCVSGHYIQAHREGCRYIDNLNKIPVAEKADIVLVSAGGYPKDINMYQAQKALDNAKHAVRDGGIIVWAAECGEGFGQPVFESWMVEYEKADPAEKIRQEFRLGGHKAAMIALVLRRAKVFLVSAMDPEVIKKTGITPYPDIDLALKDALAMMGPGAKVLVMPNGGSTLPYVAEEEQYIRESPVADEIEFKGGYLCRKQER